MELLAPVGDYESLRMAVYNGANAIYFGVNKFNARNNIVGFSIEDVEYVVNFCHLWNVKVYLALNILFKDEELQEALDIVYECNNYGVDAFIVQDLGLVSLIRKLYPNVVLHGSTQMAVHNLSGAKMLTELGFKRVVLSRETSLKEIKKITDNCLIEIEFFCQGALCVSFSGNCYMCSYMTGKSGNRGVCSQFCRLSYDAYYKDTFLKSGYLLSAKDICMIDRLQEIEKAGCSSLKIEGRARRPFYVAQACKTYRNVLDNNFVWNKKDVEDLSIAFNREYTPAYFNGNDKIISKYQNHIGIKVGSITKVISGSKFNQVYVKSNRVVAPKSSLKIFEQDKEIGTVAPFDIKRTNDGFVFTTTNNFKTGAVVNLINDADEEKRFLSEVKKLPIKISVEAFVNKPIKFMTIVGEELVSKEYFVLEQAKNQPFNELNCNEVFNKNPDFTVETYLKTDGVFVVKSKINEARIDYLNLIKQKILENYKKINKIKNINKKEIIKYKSNNTQNNELNKKIDFVVIEDTKDISNLKEKNDCVIVFSPEVYDNQTLNNFANKVVGRQWYLDLPNFALESDVEYLSNKVQELSCGVVVNNIYGLNFNSPKIGGSFLNVYNSFSIEFLNSFGLEKFFVAELSDNDILNLSCSNAKFARREKVYMTFRFCPYKNLLGCSCDKCKCDNDLKYKLNNKFFNVKREKCGSCTFYLTD